jgi:glycosyltransferase involved in cell wall biosynthesis
MQKILYVITKSNWGGAQKYVYDLALKNKKDKDDVIVAVNKKGQLTQKLSAADIPFVEISDLQRDVSIVKEFKVLKSLIKIFNKTKPDTIHLNSSKIGGLGVLAIGIYSVLNFKEKHPHVIFTAHGWAFNEDRGKFSKWVIKIISYVTIILSSETIVLSQTEYDQVSKWPFVKNKLKITDLKITDVGFLEKEKSRELLNLQNKNNDSVLIGTIAELHKNKGLKYGVEAIKNLQTTAPEKFQKIHWSIIGDGEDREYLNGLIEKYELQEKITLIGFKENAAQYLKAFDIFMLPSVKEGLPYVLLEAEAAELPIIATDVGGIKERFENYPNKIIKSKSVLEISNTLSEMIK